MKFAFTSCFGEAAVRGPRDGSSPKGVESRPAHDPTPIGRGRPFFGDKMRIGIDQGSGWIRSRRPRFMKARWPTISSSATSARSLPASL